MRPIVAPPGEDLDGFVGQVDLYTVPVFATIKELLTATELGTS
jgi:hypothetical protein